MSPPVVQSKAWCPACGSHIDPDDLKQSWFAVDEMACPECGNVIPHRYIP